jgi:hypothetical protein
MKEKNTLLKMNPLKMLIVVLSICTGMPTLTQAQFVVSEAELKKANDASRKLDSCNAASNLLAVTTRSLEKDNKILSDSSAIKDKKITTLTTKVRKSNKQKIGSLVVSFILFAIVLLK